MSTNMIDASKEVCRLQNWYMSLSNYTLPVNFVKLRANEIALLSGDESVADDIESINSAVIKRLEIAMKQYSGNCFVSTDYCAPNDTERFANKRGAVYSAASAWKYLCASKKIGQSTRNGEVNYLCVKPFRSFNQAREFRLFIYEGRLKAMSQYNLVRHFRRLEGVKEKYYKTAKNFVDEISWLLPAKNIVVDIYITSQNKVLIMDLNEWRGSTNPLLLHSWDQDWDVDLGILLMRPPMKIKGDVNVSF